MRLVVVGLLLLAVTARASQFTVNHARGVQVTIATFARTSCPQGFVTLFSGTNYFLEKTGTSAFFVDDRCLETPPTVPGAWTASPIDSCVVCKATR